MSTTPSLLPLCTPSTATQPPATAPRGSSRTSASPALTKGPTRPARASAHHCSHVPPRDGLRRTPHAETRGAPCPQPRPLRPRPSADPRPRLPRRSQYSVLIMGLDNAGKTTFLGAFRPSLVPAPAARRPLTLSTRPDSLARSQRRSKAPSTARPTLTPRASRRPSGRTVRSPFAALSHSRRADETPPLRSQLGGSRSRRPCCSSGISAVRPPPSPCSLLRLADSPRARRATRHPQHLDKVLRRLPRRRLRHRLDRQGADRGVLGRLRCVPAPLLSTSAATGADFATFLARAQRRS